MGGESDKQEHYNAIRRRGGSDVQEGIWKTGFINKNAIPSSVISDYYWLKRYGVFLDINKQLAERKMERRGEKASAGIK